MKLKQLCDAAALECPAGEEEREIEGIATDSRAVGSNFLFVCIQGLHTDGNTYIAEALKNGAVCVLTEKEPEHRISVPVLRTDSCRRAVAYLYDAWYGFPSGKLKLIGVTGTNGKTSVTHMLYAMLTASLYRCGIIGTVGYKSVERTLQKRASDPLANMTTPDPCELYRVLSEMVEDGVEYVIMEVSSHALALEKVAPLHFSAAVFTNLTPEHLDFHHTMEAYAAAKTKLFAQSAFSVINADSPYAAQMAAHAVSTCVTCSTTGVADMNAVEISSREDGVEYRISSSRTSLRLSCPIPGDFTVMNSMQSAICALHFGCSPSAIKTALASMQPVRGRMEKVRLGLGADFTVLIDYAHTPDALEKLLYTARAIKEPGGRLVILFGCGGDRDKSKRPVMGAIASRLADAVIVTSDNSRSEDPNRIIAEILSGLEGKAEVTVIPDRECAIRKAILGARAKDLILLAGKGHEEYEITREGRRPFSEKQIAIEAFEERMKQR
ncbi:MAG: UDP-N-acetylmuramoyl-L-alanyl-D-glutamate--2,6-diaminopimelate ligase [Clostridia bacterium]|nr:UDP-N-acetylmuramoyl-L-alanyl-D-glutamate--2,6-diaminopimelate ligase [Clostridia bacterium]